MKYFCVLAPCMCFNVRFQLTHIHFTSFIYMVRITLMSCLEREIGERLRNNINSLLYDMFKIKNFKMSCRMKQNKKYSHTQQNPMSATWRGKSTSPLPREGREIIFEKKRLNFWIHYNSFGVSGPQS